MTKYLFNIGNYGAQDGHDYFIPMDTPGYALCEGFRGPVSDPDSLWGQFNDPNGDGSVSYSRALADLTAYAPLNAVDFATHTYANGQSTTARAWGAPAERDGITQMFNSGECSIITNIAPLLEPINAADHLDASSSKGFPTNFTAHDFAQKAWQSGTGSITIDGWMGRVEECLARKNQWTENKRRFGLIGLQSAELAITGPTQKPFVPGVDAIQNHGAVLSLIPTAQQSSFRSRLRGQVTKTINSISGHAKYLDEVRLHSSQNLATFKTLYDRLNSGNADQITHSINIGGDSKLAAQLQRALEIVVINEAAGASLGSPDIMVFNITTGGHDDHANQAGAFNARTEAQTDSVYDDSDSNPATDDTGAAINSMREELIRLGVWNDSLAFVWTDFFRTMRQNSDGTDHGSGSNVFVMGGSVNGGILFAGPVPGGDETVPHIFGWDYNDPMVFSSNDRGLTVPGFGCEQGLAEIALWMGLTENECMHGVNADGTPGTEAAPADVVPFPTLSKMLPVPAHTGVIGNGGGSRIINFMIKAV
ncbi:MAG: DUF1501 domain-containing protein [Pseudomonadota bacterium]